jgi:hypothetical protein
MSALSAPEVLAREFLSLRAKILELAASLDRLARAEGAVADDPRLERLHAALKLLTDDSELSDRAERVQLLFSRPYDEDWQETFKNKPR